MPSTITIYRPFDNLLLQYSVLNGNVLVLSLRSLLRSRNGLAPVVRRALTSGGASAKLSTIDKLQCIRVGLQYTNRRILILIARSDILRGRIIAAQQNTD